MANKRVRDSDGLPSSSMVPASDFLLVDQASGKTAKMTVGEVVSKVLGENSTASALGRPTIFASSGHGNGITQVGSMSGSWADANFEPWAIFREGFFSYRSIVEGTIYFQPVGVAGVLAGYTPSPPNLTFIKAGNSNTVHVIGITTQWPGSSEVAILQESYLNSQRNFNTTAPEANLGWAKITNTNAEAATAEAQGAGPPFYMKINTNAIAFVRSKGVQNGNDISNAPGSSELANASYAFRIWS
jgi:hypothetical protein